MVECDICKRMVDGQGVGHQSRCPLFKEKAGDDVRMVQLRADALHKLAIVMNATGSDNPIFKRVALMLVPKLGNALHGLACDHIERSEPELMLQAYEVLYQALAIMPDVDCSKL
jgi:ornithine cyclodeaminase/alanine dehydrogenase-like protein (mu-crystallin family)